MTLALLTASTAAALAPAQAPLGKLVERALERTRPVLLKLAKTTHRGQHALVCLALADDGLTMADPPFAAAIRRLEASGMSQTYELSLRLMVMVEVRDYPDRMRSAERDLQALLRNQRSNGFTYTHQGDKWDLSNTQYAALGMRAAASLHVEIPRARWERLGRAVLSAQSYGGGFAYRPRSGPTPSMTVAGIAVLEVCRQQLNDSGSLCRKMKSGIKKGWGYMANNQRSIGAGRGSQRNYYFHYGLERAAILSDKKKVGRVDWYRTGAKMLLAQESLRGGWAQGSKAFRGGRVPRRSNAATAAAVPTAFAVLFLRRSFRKTLVGPITPSRPVLARFLPAQASEKQIQATARAEQARGHAAVPDLLRAMRSTILGRRKVAAIALPAITGRFHSFSPYRSAEQSAAVIKEAERWWLREGFKKLGR